MIKKNKWKLIISSLVILLPVLFGLIFWDKLPDTMVTHWGADGAADGWGSKAMAIFLVPCIMLVAHWLCIAVCMLDPRNKEQSDKMLNLMFWILPITSLLVEGISYGIAMGTELDMMTLMIAMFGVMFVIMGNYMPKCKQNSTIGIKLSWTLNNEENWNLTHRLAGKVWVVGGLLILASMFLPTDIKLILLLLITTVMVAVPTVYSYRIHKEQLAKGEVAKEKKPWGEIPYQSTYQSTLGKISFVFVTVLLIVVAIFMVTGKIEVQYGEDSFTIEASYWNDLTVDYAVIDSIEYREDLDMGGRISGFGSAKLQMGTFECDEFGRYTRYCYSHKDYGVVLTAEGNILVINGIDAEATKEIYNQLLQRIGGN